MAEETAQQLPAPAARPEDPCLIPSTSTVTISKRLCKMDVSDRFRGTRHLFWPPHSLDTYVVHIHTCWKKTHSAKMKTNTSLKSCCCVWRYILLTSEHYSSKVLEIYGGQSPRSTDSSDFTVNSHQGAQTPVTSLTSWNPSCLVVCSLDFFNWHNAKSFAKNMKA